MVRVLVISSAIAIAGVWLFQLRGVVTTGLQSSPQPKSSAPVPLPSATTAPANQPQNQKVPRVLKLRLTLDSPQDLQVKQGEAVIQGQVIRDRSVLRERLKAQQQTLLLKLEHIQQSSVSATRPTPSYAENHARIEAATLRVNQAKIALAEFWSRLPYTETAWNLLPLPAERKRLETLEAQLTQTQNELKLAVAQLQAARDADQLAVYKEQRQQDTPRQQKQVLAALAEIREKMAQLQVRSPYSGTVKKIKWIGQTNRELLVELTLTSQSIQSG
jgi:multidrug resistance efflux pump